MAKQPIEEGIINRAIAGVRDVVRGIDPRTWFGPNQPMAPQAPPETVGRQFDYPVGYNLTVRPRHGEEISFEQMRQLADKYDLLRLVIETRKDQLEKLPWTIRYKNLDKDEDDPKIKGLIDKFMFPDKEHPFATWLRMVVEDMLVIDAATIYPRMMKGGGVFNYDVVDGATIKRVIDDKGRTPFPPDPAYQQVLKGLPATNYSMDELIYHPRNARSHKVYGYSPVEQIIMTVNIAVRRQIHQLQFYTEGNIPEAMISVPKEWSMSQIRDFQAYWDALLAGDTAQRRHARFIPGDAKFQFTKDGAIKDEYDEWLARIVCYAFSLPPTPFVKQVNRATAQTINEAALQEGLIPLKLWSASLMNILLWKFEGATDVEFVWTDTEKEDPIETAKVNQIYIDSKVLCPNEVREEMGLDPVPGGSFEEIIAREEKEMELKNKKTMEQDDPFAFMAKSAKGKSDVVDALIDWRDRVMVRADAGEFDGSWPEPSTDLLPSKLVKMVKGGLAEADDVEDVQDIFNYAEMSLKGSRHDIVRKFSKQKGIKKSLAYLLRQEAERLADIAIRKNYP